MNTALWMGQGILSLAMLYSGGCKATQSKEWMMRHGQTGVAAFPLPAIRAIALIELLGAAELILPWLLQIAPVLTPLAAAGFGIVMLLAMRIHARRSEWQSVALNVVLLALCGFVVWGRS